MIKNRMVELKRFSNRTTSVGSKLAVPLIQPGSITDEFTQTRFIINQINSKTQQINQLRYQFRKNCHPYRQEQMSKQIQNIIKDARQLLKGLQNQIKKLSKKFVQKSIIENNTDSDHISAEIQSKQEAQIDGPKKAITIDLTRKAKIATQNFRIAEKKYSTQVRQTIKRRARLIQGQVTQQQVDQIIANPQKAQQMLMSALMNSPSVQLQNAVSDIVDKCRDIIKLQKNIEQVFAMQQQLALLVQLQGAQLDTIQNTIGQAKDFVQDGQKALGKAQQQHKSGNKKIFCIILLVLLLIGIVIIPVIVTQVG